MRTLILGYGQIGEAIDEVFSQYNPEIHDSFYDLNLPPEGEFDIMHVCFPYSDSFVDEVKRYQKEYKPKYTVIHSTVKPGTSEKLGAIHSPVIGRHPYLAESLRTFTKMIAGPQASEVAEYFMRAGIKVQLFDKAITTEILKLRDTEFYGLCIEYTKDIKRELDRHGLPFEAWMVYNKIYNEGYKELGYPHYVRPILQPIMKKIGGHCVRPNYELHQTSFTDLLRGLND